MKIKYAILFTTAIVISSNVCAGNLEDAEGAMGRGDFSTSFRDFKQLAENGDKRAQSYLSSHYLLGFGVKKDQSQAYFWSLLALDKNDKMSLIGRDLAEEGLSLRQKQDIQELARNWQPIFSNSSSQSAQGALQIEVAPTLTGSGFRVADQFVITNNHVVEGCLKLRVNGFSIANVQTRDASLDLALLSVPGNHGPVGKIASTRPQVGESITVSGFPLRGLLVGLNVTSGTITGLTGIRNDTRYLQISAPVQQGNSGGPLMNSAGSIAGIVTSKLNAQKVASQSGDIPQNVNFAIKSAFVSAFLDTSGVQYQESSNSVPLNNVKVASDAKGFTVLVECWK